MMGVPASESAVALLLVDALLLLVAFEAVVLALRHRRIGQPPAPRQFIWSLLAGACLMAALHCVLAGYGVVAMAACLAASGLCHAADLRAVRLRSGSTVRPR